MEIIKKKPSDWTDEDIAIFWNWQSQSVSRQHNYFTSVMAVSLANYINKKGLLKGEVLDYGCGKGHLLKEMCKIKNVNFYGLDFSPDSITATKERLQKCSNIKNLVVANTLPSIFSNNAFDSITIIETIEHLKDDKLEETFNELFRLLKPQGKLFITTPYNEDLSKHLHFCPFCKTEFHHIQHMQSFDIKKINSLAKKHGLNVDYCENIDIEKIRLGVIKFSIKVFIIKFLILVGLKERRIEDKPNLLAILSKPS